VIISDADVGVPADFLANVAPLFADEEVGLVQLLLPAGHPANLAMRWEGHRHQRGFLECGGCRRALWGKWILRWARSWRCRGAPAPGNRRFAALADYLADDYQLGREVARLGKRIVFSDGGGGFCHEQPENWAQVWAHEVRGRAPPRVPAGLFFSVFWKTRRSGRCSGLGVNAGSLFTVKGHGVAVGHFDHVSSQIQFSPVRLDCAVFFRFSDRTALPARMAIDREQRTFWLLLDGAGKGLVKQRGLGGALRATRWQCAIVIGFWRVASWRKWVSARPHSPTLRSNRSRSKAFAQEGHPMAAFGRQENCRGQRGRTTAGSIPNR